MTTRRPIDWEGARARLAVGAATPLDAARVEVVYRQRAARLARAPGGEDLAAARPVLVFRLGAERWGIELRHVAEVIADAACSPLPGSSPRLAGVVQVRGQIHPVWDLARRLGLPDLPDGGSCTVILLRREERPVGIRTGAVEGIRTLREEEQIAAPAAASYAKWITPDQVAVLDPGELWKEGFE